MKTTFEKVSQLNKDFGNERGVLSEPDWSVLRKQAQLCLEEAKEMMDAVEARNIFGVLDAQGDLTTVNDGVAYVGGFDGNEVYDLVHASNYTKFIKTAAEVPAAMQYYYDKGFAPSDLYLCGEYPLVCIKVSHDVTVEGKFYPKGKFLKNMASFREPDFTQLVNAE